MPTEASVAESSRRMSSSFSRLMMRLVVCSRRGVSSMFVRAGASSERERGAHLVAVRGRVELERVCGPRNRSAAFLEAFQGV